MVIGRPQDGVAICLLGTQYVIHERGVGETQLFNCLCPIADCAGIVSDLGRREKRTELHHRSLTQDDPGPANKLRSHPDPLLGDLLRGGRPNATTSNVLSVGEARGASPGRQSYEPAAAASLAAIWALSCSGVRRTMSSF